MGHEARGTNENRPPGGVTRARCLVPRAGKCRMQSGQTALNVKMKVKRAAKYGFCSGVRIADLKVKRFAAGGGRGAILGQVVHNERVVQEMEDLGVRTVDDIENVTEPTIVFSAHGVPQSFHERAKG